MPPRQEPVAAKKPVTEEASLETMWYLSRRNKQQPVAKTLLHIGYAQGLRSSTWQIIIRVFSASRRYCQSMFPPVTSTVGFLVVPRVEESALTVCWLGDIQWLSISSTYYFFWWKKTEKVIVSARLKLLWWPPPSSWASQPIFVSIQHWAFCSLSTAVVPEHASVVFTWRRLAHSWNDELAFLFCVQGCLDFLYGAGCQGKIAGQQRAAESYKMSAKPKAASSFQSRVCVHLSA